MIYGNEAFRWAKNSGMVGFGSLGGDNSSATGVSANGAIVVGSSRIQGTNTNNNNGNLQGFRWSQTTSMQGLGFFPGHNRSTASDISGDGQVIVGWSSVDTDTSDLPIPPPAPPFAPQQGFRWTQTEGMIGIGFLPSGGFSQANAVSENGFVIVGNASNGSGLYDEAFRWTQAEGMKGLGTIPGMGSTTAYAVNDDGSVIVGGIHTASATEAIMGVCDCAFSLIDWLLS